MTTIEKLKNKFNLQTLTFEESRDKYGKLLHIKEIGLTCYKRDLDKALSEFMNHYDYATSDEALAELKTMANRDNMYADYLSLREYDIQKVVPLKNNYYGVVIKFKDNGEERNFIEAGLSYSLQSKENMHKRNYRRYFTAGGLEDNEVDFLFNGVGHSTKRDMYTFDESEILRLGE